MKREKKAHVWPRAADEWYVEPRGVTEALLTVERFVGAIYDPSCGRGTILDACFSAGYTTFGSDIVDRTQGAPWFIGTADFLTSEIASMPPNIICNPPYFRAKGTEAFCRRALALATGKVCMFTEMRFLSGGKRGRGLFKEYPPNRIWMLSDRPSCPPGEWLAAGNKAEGGTQSWVWLVWSKMEPHQGTHFGWLYV